MLFNSWHFVVFLVLVWFACKAVPSARNKILLLGSYYFYGCWDWRFLSLLFLSTLIDYFIAKSIEKESSPQKRKALIAISICVSLTILGFFKYFNFFIDNAIFILRTLGYTGSLWTLNVILPVGISFYTFQTMSYTIDVYRRATPAEKDFLTFALFVSYFPQLVAGPIERAGALLHQLKNPYIPSPTQWRTAFWLVLIGLFKKTVVADNLAAISDEVFSSPANQSGLNSVLSVYAFAFQIYGDFSGYSDIARGVSIMFGVDLMKNFNTPYLSCSPKEFWQRWHISLSTWLRDYLYIPLGGNRFGARRTLLNLLITMLLGGLWHGASWNFIVWGAFHGLLLIIHRLLTKDEEPQRITGWRRWLRAIAFFQLICIGWVFFRAANIPDAVAILGSIIGGVRIDLSAAGPLFNVLVFGGAMIALDAWTKGADDPNTFSGWAVVGPFVVAVLIAALVVCPPPIQQPFIYFQF